MFKSGYVAIVGRPNVGKSTLLNAFLGQKIAVVTSKPQTTRPRILGIKNLPGAQFLFLDTPGIHKPHKSLNAYMMDVAHAALDDADVFLFLIEPSSHLRTEDREIFQMITFKKKPIIVAINKVDGADHTMLLPFTDQCAHELKPAVIIPISALHGKGISDIESEIIKRLPEGPAYYPEDQVTDQTERFLACEIIREKIMELTREEIPYSVAVIIEAFEEPPSPGLRPPSPGMGEGKKSITRIRASIICEKDSQKGILIGKGGLMLKNIGSRARKDLEEQLGTQVYLELFVRVEKEWTKDTKKVKEFSYEN